MWRLMMPKPRHLIVMAIFVSLLLLLLYAVTRHTDPYEAAERFLVSDSRVTASVTENQCATAAS